MIIDLDAHQGNGHETDFSNDSIFLSCYHCGLLLSDALIDCLWMLTGRVYILDVYNPEIYPFVSCLILEVLT